MAGGPDEAPPVAKLLSEVMEPAPSVDDAVSDDDADVHDGTARVHAAAAASEVVEDVTCATNGRTYDMIMHMYACKLDLGAVVCVSALK